MALHVPYRGIDYLDGLDEGVAGMRIAWTPDLGFPVADPAVVAGMQPAIDALVNAGADVQHVALDLSGAQPALEAIWGASHAALARHFDGAQLAALDPGGWSYQPKIFPRASCRRPMPICAR